MIGAGSTNFYNVFVIPVVILEKALKQLFLLIYSSRYRDINGGPLKTNSLHNPYWVLLKTRSGGAVYN